MIDAREDFALQCKETLVKMKGSSWELDRLREAVLLLLDVYLNPANNIERGEAPHGDYNEQQP